VILLLYLSVRMIEKNKNFINLLIRLLLEVVFARPSSKYSSPAQY
jgi:hypothetical protein